MAAWVHKTLLPPQVVSHACNGRFTSSNQTFVVLGHGTWLELLAPQTNGALHSVANQPVYANIRALRACPRGAVNDQLQVGCLQLAIAAT